ncbi:MAG: RnfABCDGE type electron transport complex subunit D [Defluviitaleaceae bacterium]|nr:RnfABCDGE type electron transport complex subunit D [Defluviitaleaceae bacterium]
MSNTSGSAKKFLVTSAPHVRDKATIPNIMRDVLIALAPTAIMATVFLGIRVMILMVISVASCIGFEYLYQKAMKKSITINDFSAAITGILIAFNMPPQIPLWVPIFGAFFAIIVVKQLFGGLGQNFLNPTLAARAFLMAAFPMLMTDFSAAYAPDVISAATPLTALGHGEISFAASDIFSILLRNTQGTVGEAMQLALIAGGIYLLIKRVISWHIPLAYIASAAVFLWIFGRDGLFTGTPQYEIFIGGIMMGAFFMATDYSTSPVTPLGHIIFGIGCGAVTVVIRIWGSFPEGVTYAILFMNLLVPLIDKITQHKIYGEVKKKNERN